MRNFTKIITGTICAVFIFTMFNNVAYAYINQETKNNTSEVVLTALPDEAPSFDHELFKKHDAIDVQIKYNETEDIFLNIPGNFTWNPAHVDEMPTNLKNALGDIGVLGVDDGINTWISTDHKMAIKIAVYDATEIYMFSEEKFEFDKTVDKNSPYTLKYTNIKDGIVTELYFVTDAQSTKEESSFEALADEIVSTMAIVPESNTLYWSFYPKENSELNIFLTNDFYAVSDTQSAPQKLGSALEEIDLGYVSEANEYGLTEVWVREDEKMAIQFAICETSIDDYEENGTNLNFEKYIIGTEPLKIAYETVINGMIINVDFVADNLNVEDIILYEQFADKVVEEIEFVYDNTYISIIEDFENKIEKNDFEVMGNKVSDSLFDWGFNVFAIILILRFASPLIRAVKRTLSNRVREDMSTAGHEYKTNTQIRNARNYGDEDEAYANHDKDLGKDYSSQSPQIYNEDKYVVDNSRYKYGMDMSDESKRKKQDQVKSMLESGMIEKDEYNERMHEIDREYR